MEFEQAWQKLNEKKPVDSDVVMTPEQFKKQLHRFYLLGCRHSAEKCTKAAAGKGHRSDILNGLWEQFDDVMNQMDNGFLTEFSHRDGDSEKSNKSS